MGEDGSTFGLKPQILSRDHDRGSEQLGPLPGSRLRGEGVAHLTGPHVETPGSVRRQKKQGKAGVKVVVVDFHGIDWTRKAEQQGTLNNRIL